MARIFGQQLAKQVALSLIVRRLEAPQEFVQGRQHLLGQLRRDDVLVLAAVGHDGGQAILFLHAEQAIDAQQHVQRREDRPAGHRGHFGDGERHVAARLAAGRVDEPQMRAAREQTDRHFGLAKQPLELGLRRGLPAAVVLFGNRIEVNVGRQLAHQHQPGPLGIGRLEFFDGVGWPQRLVVFGQRHL